MEQIQKQNKMGILPEGKLLLSMSVPLCISMLMQAIYNLVDSIFVSRLGEDALTAVSLAYPVQMLMIAVSVGTGVGMNSLISRRLGERRLEEANRAANNGIVLLLISLLTRFSLFTWLGLVLLVLCYYRSLSRNISKRTEENYQYYALKDRVDRKFRGLKDQWANRKLYHYYRCPKCRQKLRVPRGRGRIQISCPRCGTQFIKKS